MHALDLFPRNLWLTALAALALALVVVLAGEWLASADLSLFSGGDPAAETTAVPPATWATDPLAPPTILLAR